MFASLVLSIRYSVQCVQVQGMVTAYLPTSARLSLTTHRQGSCAATVAVLVSLSKLYIHLVD